MQAFLLAATATWVGLYFLVGFVIVGGLAVALAPSRRRDASKPADFKGTSWGAAVKEEKPKEEQGPPPGVFMPGR
ncbi:MAG: hypothetical protein D6741_18300 [Planctomycetota bacterium]|nr:MAG: hypothetical protein D6741_18300 [Planctomycetota bacterium]